MSEFLAKYLDAGFCEIIVESREEKEASGGTLEITRETVVVKKGNEFFRVKAESRLSFAPGGGGGSGIDSETPITRVEYTSAANGKEIIDPPAGRKSVTGSKAAVEAGYAKHAELKALRTPLYKELENQTPKCSLCGKTMVVRQNKSGRFWGCAGYPRCDGGIQYLSAEAHRIFAKLDAIQ